LEEWNTGRMEYWKNGIVEYWNNGELGSTWLWFYDEKG